MLSTPLLYQNDHDLTRMAALLQAGRAAGIDAYYPHVGDLKWSLFYSPLGTNPWKFIYLWEDPSGDHRLLGWVALAPTGDNYEVFYQPELHGSALAEEMFAWAENAIVPLANAMGRSQIGIFCVTPVDSFRIDWLEKNGYRVEHCDLAFTRSLAEPVAEAQVPKGYLVRSCQGKIEVEARAKAQYSAFGSSAPFEQYLQRFTKFMQSTVYQPNADIIAAAPDGRIASFCITWTDSVNHVGLFEPVGTHLDFQRKGLGKAVMLEALRRLQEQGMQRAIVCTTQTNNAAVGLYESAGFQQHTTFRFYSKHLD